MIQRKNWIRYIKNNRDRIKNYHNKKFEVILIEFINYIVINIITAIGNCFTTRYMF